MARFTCFSEGPDSLEKIFLKNSIGIFIYHKSNFSHRYIYIIRQQKINAIPFPVIKLSRQIRLTEPFYRVSDKFLVACYKFRPIIGLMEERDLFNEKDEVVNAEIYCPKCRTTLSYPIKWRRRTKKAHLPPGADERDRAKFAKARNYRIRLDDILRCKNPRCRKTIEISSLQTVVFD
jgi:hypothetical protein